MNPSFIVLCFFIAVLSTTLQPHHCITLAQHNQPKDEQVSQLFPQRLLIWIHGQVDSCALYQIFLKGGSLRNQHA